MALSEPYTQRVGTYGMFELAAFLVGLLFGSFLNVCISRLPKHESIVRPGSHCPQCGKPIRWYDNTPILSWIVLRGRCRECKAAIPWQYPLVELAVSLWFAKVASPIQLYWDVTRPDNAADLAAVGLHWIPFSAFSQEIILSIDLAILGFLLIGLMVMDWQTMLLPDAFTLTGVAIGLFLVCIQAIFLGPNEDQVLLTKHSLHLTSPGGVTDHGNVFFKRGRRASSLGGSLLSVGRRWFCCSSGGSTKRFATGRAWGWGM